MAARPGSLVLLALILLGASPPWLRADDDYLAFTTTPTLSVGMPGRITGLVLPGSELEPRPLTDRQAKVVVRVVAVFRHGDGFRYDLSYYGLVPGAADLRDYLRRKDGTPATDLPPIPVTFASALKDPGQIEPNRPAVVPSVFASHYRLTMFGLAVVWFVGLALLLFAGRRRRLAATTVARGPLTLGERIRPLVARARAGTLEPGERAELERTLIDYWRRRLGLTDLAPGEAIRRIRADGDAGALIRQLEAWLHRPPGEGDEVDVDELLGPYRDVPDTVDDGRVEFSRPTATVRMPA